MTFTSSFWLQRTTLALVIGTFTLIICGVKHRVAVFVKLCYLWVVCTEIFVYFLDLLLGKNVFNFCYTVFQIFWKYKKMVWHDCFFWFNAMSFSPSFLLLWMSFSDLYFENLSLICSRTVNHFGNIFYSF
jgi:hypothetical protein